MPQVLVWKIEWNHRNKENPLDCKEIQPVDSKGNQSWMFIGRTDVEAEIPILWPPDAINWLPGKAPDAGKCWMREKGMTEDEMVGWHHQLSGHEFERVPGVGVGQGGLACYSPWGLKESDTTEWLNWLNWRRSWNHIFGRGGGNSGANKDDEFYFDILSVTQVWALMMGKSDALAWRSKKELGWWWEYGTHQPAQRSLLAWAPQTQFVGTF